MNILSLFDGMSCGQQALVRAGIKYDKYFASEIDKYAIKVTMANFPETIQLGSVVDVDGYSLPKIDLLMGGSPCQSFSFAGKRKGMSTKDEQEILTLDHYLQLKSEGFEFEGQSYLFWEYMRLLNEIRSKNPNVYFLLENVEMGEKWEKVLSKAIGINGIHINSALVSAQNRKRIYWTNIGMRPAGLFGDMESIIEQPKDRGILLKDILQDNPNAKYYLSDSMINYLNTRKGNFNSGKINYKNEDDKASCINKSSGSLDISDNIIVEKSLGYIPVDEKYYLSEKMTEKMVITNESQNIIGHSGTGGQKGIIHNIEGQSSSLCATDYKQAKQIMVQNPSEIFNNTRLNQTIEKHKDQLEPGTMIDSYNQSIHKDKSITIRNRVDASNMTHIVAMRGRTENKGEDWHNSNHVQKLESRNDGKTNSITGVAKDNMVREVTSGTLRTHKDGEGFREVHSGKGATIPARAREDGSGQNVVSINSRIRRLTPIECERLQTVADNYTNYVSDSQRYKMLGNGWTIDVIVHILNYLKNEQ